MVTSKVGAAFAETIVLETGTSTVNARDILIRQFVSDPIVGAQTISGTLKGQLRIHESDIAANYLPQIMVSVVSNNGLTVRGTPFGGDTRTTNVDEMATVSTNGKIPAAGISPVTLTSVSALDGDRLVVEIGCRANNTVTTDYTVRARFGCGTATADLAEGGVETTDLNPWVEFSANINFSLILSYELVGMVAV